MTDRLLNNLPRLYAALIAAGAVVGALAATVDCLLDTRRGRRT
ncbi:hypothetical protein ACFYO9_37600 [Streptomyces sp. NPDC005863]